MHYTPLPRQPKPVKVSKINFLTKEELPMISEKRIVIATICGLIAGLFCIAGGMIIFGMTFPPLGIVYVLSSRMLIGFVIGISSLRLPWVYHGLLIGFMVGLPFPIYDLIIGMGPVIASAAFTMSLVFGVAIECVTTIVFKAERVFH